MATVVGKTSTKIDELLADLIVGASIVNGNLILTQRDGGQVMIGGVGNSGSVQRILYTSGAYPARPTGVLHVEWIGPTLPPAMAEKDTWVIVP